MIAIKIDSDGYYLSHRELSKYDTWSEEEIVVDVLPFTLNGLFHQYKEGVWLEHSERVAVVYVPTEIRMAQCRAQLIIDGKDDDVELLMASIADSIQQKLYRAYFEYEPIVKRDNAMIIEMAPALAIDLDTFFINASKL